MFVFPLGLQAKTRDFPWMTVAILVATSMYSVLSFDVLHAFIAASLNDPAALARVQTQKIVVAGSCNELSLLDEECGFLKAELHPEKLETEHQLLLRLLDSPDSLLEREKRSKLVKLMAKPALVRSLLKRTSRASLPEFADFDQALRLEDRATISIARAQAVLTRGSVDLRTLLRSLFVHAGWMHLIGNMAFFLMFAIPLESRIGALALAGIYFLGGASGMMLELILSVDATRPLLGASAAVSAVAAAFLVAFWPYAVRVFVSLFFVFNQIVHVPAWMFFGFFVLIHDVSGALSPERDGVAHVAHLGGFGIGALLGAIAVQLNLMMRPFVFPFELKMFVESRKIKDRRERMAMLQRLLFFNPQNTAAVLEAWRLLENLPSLAWAELSTEDRRFLADHACELLRALANIRIREKNHLAGFLERATAADWPWSEILRAEHLPRLMALTHRLKQLKRDGDGDGIARIMLAAFPASVEAVSLEKMAG